MNERRHYERAPITEAIIDLRIAPRADLTLDTLHQLCQDNQADYPRTKPTIEAQGTLQVRPDGASAALAQQRQTGFCSTSRDGKYVCQRQIGGFTFSRLAPYESWEPFRDRARTFWNAYRAATEPQDVRRLAVRYINRIDVPCKAFELKDYFRTSPELSPDLPQAIAGFFMQVQVPQPDILAQVTINETIVPPSSPAVVSVVLDLDVFRATTAPHDEDAIWDFFETLHTRKNEVFEACITDRTRELFD